MRILVTGGSGFVGTAVVTDLVRKGIQVRVLDKTKASFAAPGEPPPEVIQGGIEDGETVQNAMHGVDVVYHLADTFSSKPREGVDVDVKGNVNLLEAAVAGGVRHFLFASTHRVYGRSRYVPIDENHPLNPEESGRALYAVLKLANEKLCLWYWQERGLPVTIFRFWWSFGRDIGGKALRNLIDTALKGALVRVPDPAGGSFLHNDDAARAFHLATLNDRAYGEVFNLSSGAFTTWRDLAELVCERTGSTSTLELVPSEEWQGDVSIGDDRSIPYVCRLDIGKAERLLGFKPTHGQEAFDASLRAAVDRLVTARRAR